MKLPRTLRIAALVAIAVIISAAALTGCRASRSAAISGTGDATEMTLAERARDVAAANLPWTQLNLPVKIAVKSPQKISLSGRIYMRRDRDIFITLRVLGMEVANMYVNSDSVYAADKLHKYYIAEPIKDIFAGASLSIGDIQDALLGRPFINNRGTLTDKMLSGVTLTDSPDNQWIMTPRSRINGKIEYQFKFSKESNALMSLVFNTGSKLYGCTYSSPAEIDGSRFMERIAIATKVGKTAIDATITFDFNKVKWEVPSSARWRNPSGYKRITPAALAKSLKEK